jgi:hypothetical protein
MEAKMYEKRFYLILLAVFLMGAAFFAACSETPAAEVTRVVEVQVTRDVPGERVEIEVTRLVEVEVMIPPDVPVIPFEKEWLASAHADSTAVAFNYWNNSEAKEIPVTCAKCHSTDGFLDFLGVDGSAAGAVDHAASLGSVVSCEACHNQATMVKTSVTFPSGLEVTGLGAEARCMECHQGRASTVTVDASIERAGLGAGDEDKVSADLGFTNIHYFAAAATQFGSMAKGGYEYPGKSYDSFYEHVAPYQTCTDCHNVHTLEVKVDECAACHTNVRTREDLVNIRMEGSLVDYDGDGDMSKGVYHEIEGLRAILYQGLQTYAREVSGTPIVYSKASHPYFYIDTNGDGVTDEAEVNRENRYNTWTPRLAKAAYNYQVSLKDPGRFAHGGKYIIQLLYDSIEDLNVALAEPVDLTNARRIDHGHFAGSETAFRYWDATGVVPATCSKCHSAAGLPFFLTENVSIRQPASNGLSCATCHNDVSTFTRFEVADVTFPSGAKLTTGNSDSNLCLNCHQGRESTVSVNRLIGNLEADTVSENLRFLNIHYFAAGATLFGTEAKGAYEYPGQTYVGRFEHVAAFDTCIECHSTHALEVKVARCADCHGEVRTAEDLPNIRITEVDFDGDGDMSEGLAFEIETMRNLLYTSLQEYAAETVGTGIVYSSARHPYFFIDSNGNGEADREEINGDNRYVTWTPRLLRAAYNYQYAKKDTGVYAHNGLYIIQVLYDALNDIGADTSGMTRP